MRVTMITAACSLTGISDLGKVAGVIKSHTTHIAVAAKRTTEITIMNFGMSCSR